MDMVPSPAHNEVGEFSRRIGERQEGFLSAAHLWHADQHEADGCDSMTRVIIVTGASGAGKTTIGRRLAEALGWTFIEGDDLHPAENVAKMRSGRPLNDADRAPWLDALRERIAAHLAAGEPAVVACSALKREYRNRLRVDPARVEFVFLHGTEPLLRRRLEQRKGHYMKPAMLRSQLGALEPPNNAVWVDISLPVDAIVAAIRQHFAI
jgi:gluconokinase